VGGWEAARRRQVVTALSQEYPVRWLCRLFGCPRAALYRPTEEAGEEEERLRSAVRRLAGRLAAGRRLLVERHGLERFARSGRRYRRSTVASRPCLKKSSQKGLFLVLCFDFVRW